MAYRPEQGDIVYVNFSPQTGHEQAGWRPAVVVSNGQYHRFTGNLALLCPITNTLKPFPLHVQLDERTKTSGMVLCEHVKSMDLAARTVEFREILPDDLLRKVLDRLVLSIE